ncbi:unnamed protein product [Phytomonas sp. EM1]|nr:unnamed protein product [Phytomonas sp. EM1]|eukprot:CCW60767.1 unnamed protein product [Phytomonas sp. isolate EM1]
MLRENLPEPSKAFLSQGALPASSYRRQRLLEVKHELDLPHEWMPSASRALQKACHGLIQDSIFEETDYFLCALLHPTFIPQRHPRAAELRRLVAMPSELSFCGMSSLQLLRQALELHQRSMTSTLSDLGLSGGDDIPANGPMKPPSVSFLATPPRYLTVDKLEVSDLERVPLAAELESFLLFDPKVFSTPQLQKRDFGTPQEVLLATTTALCGAIELTQGTLAVASFLERMLKRKEEG